MITLSTMTEADMETSFNFDLLHLPDAAFSIIIAGLADSDKKMIMAAFRKAFDMAMLNAEITVKVTKGSKFSGFRKVLNTTSPAKVHLQIICPTDAAEYIHAVESGPLSTIAILMSMVPDSTLTQLAANCQGKAWENITKVTIKGGMMKCLVPRFIALTCPKLVQLKIMQPSDAAHGKSIFNTEPGEALPLTVCTSLKQLEIDDYLANLPASYHTLTELQENLPNIDTLVFKNSSNASLVTAFAEQLTRLEIHDYDYEDMGDIYAVGDVGDMDDVDPIQRLIRSCANLQHLVVPVPLLPDSTADLRVLEFSRNVTDDDMPLLLQLPSGIKLRLPQLSCIRQDWSHHACQWQDLHIGSLHFTMLANLNLGSLKKLSVGPNAMVSLPDPSETNSLSDVQCVVDGLSHIGQIVVKENESKAGVSFGQSGELRWHIPNRGMNHEAMAAELIRVAAQRVGPCKACDCQELVGRQLPLAAVLQWGKTFIESVCLGRNYDLQPHVWQALQQLDRLHTIVLWGVDQQWNWLQGVGNPEDMLKISYAVYAAAQQYVIPANRSLRIECGFSRSNLEPAVVTEIRSFLYQDIQQVLPAGCKLASVECASMEGKELYTGYRNWCLSTAFWVVNIEPLQLPA